LSTGKNTTIQTVIYHQVNADIYYRTFEDGMT